MKHILLFMIAALGTMSLSYAQEKGGSEETTFELNSVIKSINNSLSQVQNGLDATIGLAEASITLQTSATNSTTGGFKIFAKASKKWSKEHSNSITYNFTPAKVFTKAVPKDALAIVIKKAAEEYKNAANVGNLSASSFEVEVSFAITNVTTAGIEYELFGVALEADKDFERKVFHKIVLKFK